MKKDESEPSTLDNVAGETTGRCSPSRAVGVSVPHPNARPRASPASAQLCCPGGTQTAVEPAPRNKPAELLTRVCRHLMPVLRAQWTSSIRTRLLTGVGWAQPPSQLRFLLSALPRRLPHPAPAWRLATRRAQWPLDAQARARHLVDEGWWARLCA